MTIRIAVIGAGLMGADPELVIAREDIDAVIVASPDFTHAPLSLACLAAGKKVLCEEPLSQSPDDYVAVMAALDQGRLGRARMMHNFHRNVETPAADFTGAMAITNSAPHEFDVVGHVMGCDYTAISAFQPKRSDARVAPVMMVLETDHDQLVTIEINNNAAYGYDVRAELVGEAGAIAMNHVAYTRQNRAFLKFVTTGAFPAQAASAWDGYAAAIVAEARARFGEAFATRGLEIIALNANGNPLHPTDAAQGQGLRDAIRLAGLMGIKTVCTMSGLPAGSPSDSMPNWVVSSWPPETQAILRYQWDEKLIPFWTEIVALARENGVERIAQELHGNQVVYNVPSLLKLRAAVGPVVGANLDPSHLFWMGAAVYHVHAKDTFLNRPKQATTSLLENGSLMDIPARAWSYITLGFGHGEEWWRQFCYRLKMGGYDGWLSIEHEDVLLNGLEGLEKSVALLQGVMPRAPRLITNPKLSEDRHALDRHRPRNARPRGGAPL